MFKKPRLKKFLILLIALLVTVGLVKYSLHKLSSPAEGTISVAHTNDAAITDSTSYSALSNEYFSLLYPSELTADFPEQKPASSLLNYSFLSKRDSSNKITDSLEVYIKTLPHGGVALDSEYKDYASQQKLYKFSQKSYRSELIDIMSRDSGPKERIAMWVHGNYLMIVKLKGNDKGLLNTQFTTILKSTQWTKS